MGVGSCGSSSGASTTTGGVVGAGEVPGEELGGEGMRGKLLRKIWVETRDSSNVATAQAGTGKAHVDCHISYHNRTRVLHEREDSVSCTSTACQKPEKSIESIRSSIACVNSSCSRSSKAN